MKVDIPALGPVRPSKIICVGRNYAAHAVEMGATQPVEPILFLKPPSALVPSGGQIVLPRESAEVHHEAELVVAISVGGRKISEADALGHVAGYALGLDMTARDLQALAKKAGLPWSVAKGFDSFAPLGRFVPAASVDDPRRLTFSLSVNGEERQVAKCSHMVFSVAQVITYASRIFTLEAGDLIYTGTPSGVARVRSGDRCVVSGEGLETLEVTVVDA